MNKYVIYTSLTGGYDNLPQYPVIDNRFDYICFTNDYPDGSKVGMWQIQKIPTSNANNVALSRFVKLLPHRVLDKYEYSVWLDANLVIEDQAIYDKYIERIEEGGLWYGIQHPIFNCIYDDIYKCIKVARLKFKDAYSWIKHLNDVHYPKNQGLFENNIIIRNHNAKEVVDIDEQWWQIFEQYAKRDQFSLFYIFWRHNFSPRLIFSPEQHSQNTDGITFIKHQNITFSMRVRNKLLSWRNRYYLRKYQNLF